MFRVEGPQVERMVVQTDWENEEAIAFLQHRLKRLGVEKALEKAGAVDGDEIRIVGRAFEFESVRTAEDLFKELDLVMKPAGCAHAADHGKRLVIKIGSSTLTTSESKIDYAYLAEVTDQVARVRAAGWRPIVVTSAAIACGLERLSIEKRPHDMPSLQAAASVGQSALSTAYAEAFARHGIVTSTVLLTRRDTADRRAYLHARDTFDRLLELGVVPIVNENDTISVEQIRFGDNDTLAALVACLVEADLMVILSDIEGLYDANPHHHPDANLIGRVEAIGPEIMAVAGEAGTTVGSGGMITKIKAARVLMVAGIPHRGVRRSSCGGHRGRGGGRATWARCFVAAKKPHEITPKKLWIALGDCRARRARCGRRREGGAHRARQLASVGGRALGVEGRFEANDIVDIKDATGHLFARGKRGVR